jgi:asparagine synthase (glutamine-hydrolysing)
VLFRSHDSVAFFLLSAEVAQRVKAVQTGQGADEAFGGYNWSPSFLAANDATEQYQRAYFDWSHVDLARLMSPEFVRKISASGLSRISLHRPSASTAVDKALQIDTEIMLIDDPVKRVDSMTTAHGLEGRVPSLDHEVVELAARIPANLKVRGDGKYILREAARKFVPAEVIDRSKGYFPVPSLRYLRGPFLSGVKEILRSKRARKRALYRTEFIEHMLKNPEAEMSPKGHSRLWQAALLETWLQAHAI